MSYHEHNSDRESGVTMEKGTDGSLTAFGRPGANNEWLAASDPDSWVDLAEWV